MIQRIQTVFLLLSLIATVLMFFTPIIEIEGISVNIKNDIFQTLAILTGLIIAITLATIFLYKKRNLQIRLCLYNMILMVAFYGLFYYLISSEIPDGAETGYKFAAILPIISLILTFLAFRGIRRDEALIKSLNRLR